jgi:uncharacterized membrane protein YphA (DoxX/SURF4 family)
MAIETRTELTDGTPVVPVATRVYPTGAASVGLLALRVPLGVYFILAGVAKFSKIGLDAFVTSNLSTATAHMFGNEGLARAYLTALPFAEIALGAMLVLGLLTRVAGLLCTLLLVSFTIAATGIKHQQLPFHPNVVYIGATLAVLLCGPGRLSLDHLLFGRRRKVVIREEYTERLP